MTAEPSPTRHQPTQPPPSKPRRERDDLSTSRLARFGVAVVVFGFFLFFIGVVPDVIQLGITPGIGLLQTGAFLVGISLMTLGTYIYAYATRHRAMPRRLREDIGLRLMATGLVMAYATGFADVLGIGSHFGLDRPLFGLWQAAGVAGGVFIIITGIILYARR